MSFDSLNALNKDIPQMIKRNSFAVISHLKDCFSPKKVEDGYWCRISSKGKFNLSDYGAGIYSVELYTTGYNVGYPQKDLIKWNVRFRFGNLDDGSWGAWSKYYDTKEEAIKLVEKIAPILDDLTVMPTDVELNEMLRPFGLFGEYES